MIKANPNYKPPTDYRPEKKYRKLRIPIDEYPGYNFIGLIIGPRGNTQKRMERVRPGAAAVALHCTALPVLLWWSTKTVDRHPSRCWAVIYLFVGQLRVAVNDNGSFTGIPLLLAAFESVVDSWQGS